MELFGTRGIVGTLHPDDGVVVQDLHRLAEHELIGEILAGRRREQVLQVHDERRESLHAVFHLPHEPVVPHVLVLRDLVEPQRQPPLRASRTGLPGIREVEVGVGDGGLGMLREPLDEQTLQERADLPDREVAHGSRLPARGPAAIGP